jgi:predicted ATPase
MQAVARTGSVVVSEATRKLVEGYFQLKSIGPTRVKGVSEPVNVYEVTGLGPIRTRLQRSAARGYTKFVGRHAEMEALKRAAERAQTGRGQIVAAMAEPGVGKSRLFHEFKVTSQSGWMLLEAMSFSHDKASAYMPVVDLLSRYFDIELEDDGRRRREKVAGKIAILDRALEDTLPYLYGLLGLSEENDPLTGMDAPIRRQRTLDAVKRILLRESLNQPLMIIFEDLHWIDDETQAFLNLLADSIDSAKILLAVNYRPEYSHQWGSKFYCTQLRLDPLGRESAQEMLSSLLGDGSELSPLKGLILGKTEGNPLFMEEIVQALYEEGTLAHDGGAHLTRPLDALKVPTSVQAVLAARIDRLPAKQKESLQMLAVVGTEFPLSLVRAMSERASESELDRTLEQLQLADFIYEQPAAGDIEYTFKHALTQEVAYNSVLHERRKALHERIGAAIESLYADSLDDHVTELARHYSRSNRGAKAAHYLHLAAIQAQQRGAFGDAVL